MPEVADIEHFARQLAREFHPEKVVLFGSHALGAATADSDVDLLVMMPFEGHGVEKAIEILHRLNPRFPIDLLVRTPEQVRTRLALNDFFLQEVMDKGKVLHDASEG